jgi:hypothetical protein
MCRSGRTDDALTADAGERSTGHESRFSGAAVD